MRAATAGAITTRASKEEWRDQWRSHCVQIDAGRNVFDIKIPRPLGAELRAFPDRPGVGVAAILEGGNTWRLNAKVFDEGVPSPWVLEGDEVVGINGTPCEGEGIDEVVALIAASEDPEVTLRLSRNWLQSPKGPVKTVFMPSGKLAAVSRGDKLEQVATLAEEEVKYSCCEGWCGTCWHKEPGTGVVHKMCQDEVPRIWDNIVPLVLTAAPNKQPE